jgi:hypothetical protein
MSPMRDQAATWIGVAGDPEFLQHVGRFFGPHCGIVVGEPALLEALEPDKLLPSTDATPEKFELGTLAPRQILLCGGSVPADGTR